MAHWTVVGGEQTGGLVVRQGVELSSAKLKERLETGARVAQVELQGERLRFRRLEGHGPETGWVSLKLKEKPLLLPAASLPQAVTSVSELFGGRLEVECLELPKHLRVRVATISDIHVDQKANMEWFQKHLPRKAPDDFNVLLLPGDVSDDPVIFKEAMKMLIETRTAESLKGGDSIDPT